MDILSSFHLNDTDIPTESERYNLDGLVNSSDDELDYGTIPINCIIYNLEEEQQVEQVRADYHFKKENGNWYYSKMIITHSWQDKNNTDFFWDYLDKLFRSNNDSFNNIQTVYYKNELDIDIIYSFESEPGKHLIDNLRIPSFKPNGIIFNNPLDANKWTFKIIVITSRGIYSANRYISEDVIGFY